MNISMEELKRLYVDEGWSANKIAGVAGIKHPSVIRRLRDMGVDIRPKVQLGLDQRMAEIVRLYTDGRLSTITIAKRLRCSKRSILRLLDKANIQRRDASTSHIGLKQSEVQIAKQKETCKRKFQREGHPQWAGGRWMSGGYIFVRSDDHPNHHANGYVMEHRLVMEKRLGRFLEPEEVVHHVNSIRSDNRDENLMLFPNNSAHLNYHAAHPVPHAIEVVL